MRADLIESARYALEHPDMTISPGRYREMLTACLAAFDTSPAYAKAVLLGEPVFVLRAQDPFAADLVRTWTQHALANFADEDKVAGAFAIATAMEQWPVKKTPD